MRLKRDPVFGTESRRRKKGNTKNREVLCRPKIPNINHLNEVLCK